jgi:hypothetical protein
MYIALISQMLQLKENRQFQSEERSRQVSTVTSKGEIYLKLELKSSTGNKTKKEFCMTSAF